LLPGAYYRVLVKIVGGFHTAMRSVAAAYFMLASLIGLGTAAAAECPPGALGTSRTIVVDPTEHVKLGGFQYRETLPLKDREVVLTFDDGPLPPYTSRILDQLASECVKATFFMVGRMVRGYPSIVRRIYNEGHTIANHSQNHPFTFHKMTVEHAAQEIEDGFASLRTALGDPKAVAPFFRIPGLLRQDSVERYLASQGYMTWSVDFVADDWTHISADEVARRAINRLEANGRGILLLHDIQPATALAFPTILRELKARGFKVVHVVPATPDRPKTVSEPELWALRNVREPKYWPRVLTPIGAEMPEPVLAAPNPENFGVMDPRDAAVKVALTPSFERPLLRDGESLAAWPHPTSHSGPASESTLPIAGRHNFRYVRVFRPDKLKLANRKPATTTSASGATSTQTKPKDPNSTSSPPAANGPRPPRMIGHQLSVARPPFPFLR
jgi:peptidoglycan-N-acetylglucosamine deacetylase